MLRTGTIGASLSLFVVTIAGAMFLEGRAQTPAALTLTEAERVYRQLFTRTDQDGKPYDQEELEPPFAPGSKFLTDGESHRRALAVLDDFLKGEPEKKLTPLERAVLQHDLWGVLATTTGETRERWRETRDGRILRTGQYYDDGEADLERPRQRRELQRRLVAVMRRIALSPREVAALPDNLADAVKSAAFAKEFDPKRPERPYLPPDLRGTNRPWLGISNRAPVDGLVAPQHTAFVKGRSVFTIRLLLPGGDGALEAYLQKSARGNLGQFPEGTYIALVRRMLHIDDAATPRPTRLTESVELRYYRKPERGSEPLDIGTPAVFVLSRKDLLAGRNGGLRPVGPEEKAPYSFQARMGRTDFDPLETPQPRKPGPLLQQCASCHARSDGRGGVHSLNTLTAGEPDEPQGLGAMTDATQEKTTSRWVRRTYTWGLIQGLWEAPVGRD